MRVAVSTDEASSLTESVQRYLQEKGHEVVPLGALRDKGMEWVDASRELGEAVASGRCREGVLFCWTGTGSAIAANKVPGIRAALCVDAEEARGARKWNHANVLVMSLRLTSEAVAREILDVWFSEPYGKEEFDVRNVGKLGEMERQYAKE